MKNKLLELAAFVFMFCTVLIPNQVFSVYFQYASEPLSETSYLCRYLLTTIAWLIFLYYIVNIIPVSNDNGANRKGFHPFLRKYCI